MCQTKPKFSYNSEFRQVHICIELPKNGGKNNPGQWEHLSGLGLRSFIYLLTTYKINDLTYEASPGYGLSQTSSEENFTLVCT